MQILNQRIIKKRATGVTRFINLAGSDNYHLFYVYILS